MTIKNKVKPYEKYRRYANGIKKLKSPQTVKSGFGQSKTVTLEFDEKKISVKCKSLYSEILNTLNVSDIKNKFWYKLIKHYSELS